MNTEKISVPTAFMMFLVAVGVDLTQIFILGAGALGIIADVPAAILFGIWCSHLNVSLLHRSRVGGFLGTIVLEGAPFIDDIPWWTIYIINTIRKEWRTPRQYNEAHGLEA